MKTLSLWEPWATLIVTGHKKVETRSWKSAYRGPLLIHASKRWTAEQIELMDQEPYKSCLRGLEKQIVDSLGHVVGICQLNRIVTTRAVKMVGHLSNPDLAEHEIMFGDYREGRYAWMLSAAAQFKTPLPAKGCLSVWEFDAPAWVQRIAGSMTARNESDQLFKGDRT